MPYPPKDGMHAERNQLLLWAGKDRGDRIDQNCGCAMAVRRAWRPQYEPASSFRHLGEVLGRCCPLLPSLR